MKKKWGKRMNKTSKKWAVSSAAVLAAVSLATFSIDNTTTVSAATKKAKSYLKKERQKYNKLLNT